MKSNRLLFILLSCFIYTISAQEIVTSTYLGSATKSEISAIVGLPIFQYDVDYYKLTYESTDARGELDTLSALLVLPKDAIRKKYPVLFYEHGTSACKECVPSRFGSAGGDEGQVGLVFGGMGYISLLPDYVGMGDGRGFQTYVHAATSFSASDDLLKAFKDWAPSQSILFNDQLFISGYSQGGYASMAFHKGIQSQYGARAVTAAAHASGPYSLSGVMRQMILSETPSYYPAYIPNTVLGLNEVHGIYSNLSDFFKLEYIDDILAYYTGTISLTELNSRLINTLTITNGSPIARQMIVDAVATNLEESDDYILNQLLQANDVHLWKPESPTRLYYCRADDQVPYQNSIAARDSMYNRGADTNLVKAEDVNTTANHTECISSAFIRTVLFFGGYQTISIYSSSSFITSNALPVITQDRTSLYVSGADIIEIKIWDINGKLKTHLSDNSFRSDINLSNFESGVYIIQVKESNGHSSHQKFIVRK